MKSLLKPNHAHHTHQPITYSMTAPLNPFTGYLELTEGEEAGLFESTRTTRLGSQIAQLLTTLTFKQDQSLHKLHTLPDYQDPRHSLIFIARPPTELSNALAHIQQSISQIFTRIINSNSSNHTNSGLIWSTPIDQLHLTVLDLLSCVSEPEIEALKTNVSPTHIVEGCGNIEAAVLDTPKLMIDASAIAINFQAKGYLKLRGALWDSVVADGHVPVMRYVAISGHVTIARYLQDIPLSKQQMARLLEELQNISLSSIPIWTIDKHDIQCKYGQVYYGGGYELH